MTPPQMHRLYRFWVDAEASDAEVDQEWEGWWSGRTWHALYDMGIWDPQFVVRWDPLLTEETRTLDDGMAGSTWTGGIPMTIISRPNTVQRRLVTKWESALGDTFGSQ